MNWKLKLVGALLVVTIIFIAQNFQVAEVHFLFWTFKASRALILLATLFTGFIMGWIIGLFGQTMKRSS